MNLSPQAKASLLAHLLGRAWASLHTADPGETGNSEVRGAGYNRMPAGLRVSGTAVRNEAEARVSSLPKCKVTHLGFWDSPAGGNFIGSLPITPIEFSLGDVGLCQPGDIEVAA